jgi:hypothetical protein
MSGHWTKRVCRVFTAGSAEPRDHKPLDQFTRVDRGARQHLFEPAANYYRANRNATTRAEAAAQVFLGTRLQCAQCHNHPFDRWTQDDYYSWAAVFGKVQYKVLENRRQDSNDSHEFKGEQIVYVAHEGEVKNPKTGRAASPRFLGTSGSPTECAAEFKPGRQSDGSAISANQDSPGANFAECDELQLLSPLG